MRTPQTKEYRRAYYWKTRARRLERAKAATQKLRALLIESYGGACAGCGIADSEVLDLDHVSGGGTKEHRKKGAYHIWRKALKEKSPDFQLLCRNCNWKKYLKGKQCG